jgi:hypothetical protein
MTEPLLTAAERYKAQPPLARVRKYAAKYRVIESCALLFRITYAQR